jgi:hypothetical protein
LRQNPKGFEYEIKRKYLKGRLRSSWGKHIRKDITEIRNNTGKSEEEL